MLEFLLGFSLQTRFHRHHVMSIDWFHDFMLDELYELIYKLRALRSCCEGHNMLIRCICKLYFLIAYLIISYGSIKEYCQAPALSVPLTAKPGSKRGIELKKITFALHEYSKKTTD